MKNTNVRSDVRCRELKAGTSLICVATLLASILGGCATPHPLPPPTTPHDYRDRHPIVLSEYPYVIDVFPSLSGGKIDSASKGRLKRFLGKYHEYGHGPVTLAIPRPASATGRPLERERAAIVSTLAGEGLDNVVFVDYPVADVNLAAPIRLSFVGMKAKVADRCGQWPRDLASGSSLDGWENQTYWNFGCATQNMIATQTSDPRDLVSPRGATPADIEMRMRGIVKLRQGADPATSWAGKPGSISGVGN